MASIVKSTEAATVNLKLNPWALHPTSVTSYEIPEKLKNSFYLANAALCDNFSWFIHRTYEQCFPAIGETVQKLEETKNLTTREVYDKLTSVIGVLDHVNSVIDVRFPVKRNSGKYEIIRGFRSQHGLEIGHKSTIGGLAINENITRDYTKALSISTTYKNAVMGIGLAGAHGGIKINPNEYSKDELQKIVHKYTLNLNEKGYCYDKDIFQPDMGCTADEMSWISQIKDKKSSEQSKTLSQAGFEDLSLTGPIGAFMALDFFLHNEEIMNKINLDVGLEGKTFIIQGFGKMGTSLAEILVKHKAVCIGIKEVDGHIYDRHGIDINDLLKHKTNTGSIQTFERFKQDKGNKVLQHECDILVLAAGHKTLMCYTAEDVKAKVVLEASDGPITPGAHRILIGANKFVIPDLFACAGCNVASFLEYLRSVTNKEEILKFSYPVYGHALNGILEQKLIDGSPGAVESSKNILQDTLSCLLRDVGKKMVNLTSSNQLGLDVRTAAYMIAINNILEIMFSKRLYI